jgi:N-acetylmuramoyl-L-alanine amidase
MEQKIQLKPEDIKYLVIHHSGTSRDLTTFESVRDYHINERGFWDIGYHYFIDGKGILHKGRPENYVGAHTATPPPSMNFMSLGICLAGNFNVEIPNQDQLITLSGLIRDLRQKYNIPISNVIGHCEAKGAHTLCPGLHLLEWLRKYRFEEDSDKLSIVKQELNKIKQIVDNLLRKL